MYKINTKRIKNCFEKAAKGEAVTLGFLGGSITQGSLATTEENCYAYQVFLWWKKEFPDADIRYVNGGIGGTSSHYGVARAVKDVLMYQPDLVVVDFSVNDDADLFFQETFEGTLRRILSWPSHPGVLILNNVFYDTGENAQEFHNSVGAWYQVPYVSMKDTLYQQIQKGIYTREELTSDGLHPNDKGHALVAGEIIRFLESVQKGLLPQENEGQGEFPQPFTANAYEYARRLTIGEINPKLGGFYADTREKMGHLDHFKNGWIGKKKGDSICFETECSCIAVQYRKTIQRPAASAWLILDEDREHPVLLDANFQEDWGDCLYLQPVLHHGKHTMHKVEIIIKEADEITTPFYLMSLIVA